MGSAARRHERESLEPAQPGRSLPVLHEGTLPRVRPRLGQGAFGRGRPRNLGDARGRRPYLGVHVGLRRDAPRQRVERDGPGRAWPCRTSEAASNGAPAPSTSHTPTVRPFREDRGPSQGVTDGVAQKTYAESVAVLVAEVLSDVLWGQPQHVPTRTTRSGGGWRCRGRRCRARPRAGRGSSDAIAMTACRRARASAVRALRSGARPQAGARRIRRSACDAGPAWDQRPLTVGSVRPRGGWEAGSRRAGANDAPTRRDVV